MLVGWVRGELRSTLFQLTHVPTHRYNGERLLLMDDYDPRTMTVNDLFKVLDCYALRGLPVKTVTGGVTADWTEVVFTSNHDPRTWWPKISAAHLAAFARRVRIRYVKDRSFQQLTFESLYNNTAWPDAPAFGATSANMIV